MQQFWARVLFAALLSIIGALSTRMWARSQRAVTEAPHEEAEVAVIASSTNEVMKRPGGRQIWRTAGPSEALYWNEAVRTAGNAEAKIRFEDGTVLELDADSVVEIRRGEAGINLGFLKGSLFIRAEGTSAITVQSGEEKIALANANVALSKASPTAVMDVDVVKGEIKVLKTDPTAKPQTRLKLLKPSPDQLIFLKPDANEKVAIEWEKLDASFEVSVETGDSSSTLTTPAEFKPVRGPLGRADVPFKIGKSYYRVTARTPQGLMLMSAVKSVKVLSRTPPTLISPALNSVVKPEASLVTFTWSNPGGLLDQRLVVARKPNLKESLYSDTVGEKLSLPVAVGAEPGQVYWRVSGRLPGTSQMISSQIWSFHAHKRALEPLAQPILKTPAAEQKIAYNDMRAFGVNLTWTPVKGANLYELSLTEPSGKIIKRESASNSVNIQNLKPGAYGWKLVAKDEFEQVSPVSETRNFLIEGLPMLAWSDGLTDAKYVYKTPKPTFKVSWERAKAVSYKVRVYAEREPASEDNWKTVAQPSYEAAVPEDGRYKVEAEAIDAAGTVIARTLTRNVDVGGTPLLAAPSFYGDADLEARADGMAELAWQPVREARQYNLQILDATGKVAHTSRLATPSAEVRLKTGAYKVVLQAIDALGRPGPESEPRTLRVPEYSDLRAPKVKSATVK